MKQIVVNKIKELRIQKGYTQQIMAQKLGIEQPTYQRLESGCNEAWAKYLFDILLIYDKDPSDFFNEISGKDFINQSNTDFKNNSRSEVVLEKLQYADKTIVKNLLAQKDKTIVLLEEKIKHLEEQLGKSNIISSIL
jgi:transcriptional regulator with XRE-family HTH domain